MTLCVHTIQLVFFNIQILRPIQPEKHIKIKQNPISLLKMLPEAGSWQLACFCEQLDFQLGDSVEAGKLRDADTFERGHVKKSN